MFNEKADNDVIVRSTTELQLLAELLKQNFSFKHKTIADACKTVNTGIYAYTFDATTLLPYESNMNYKEERVLDDLLYPFYQKMDEKDHETYKEFSERRVLLWFLLCAPKQYRECEIEKQIRPDFILTGEKRIGVEITELITSLDRNLFSLTRQIRERGLHTQEEIEEHIHRYHKGIEDKVILDVEDGMPILSTGGTVLTAKRIHFAEEIKRKYEKYKDIQQQYDEFIILGNAASGARIEISEQDEVDELMDYVLCICPDIIDMTTVIAWREEKNREQSNSHGINVPYNEKTKKVLPFQT